MLRNLLSFFVFATVLYGHAKTIYDSPDVDMNRLFLEPKTKYVIRYSHAFSETVKVPKDCELLFDGGSLSGPIVFNKTKLSGEVNLKGSSLSGSVINKLFDASWLCYMDGETDDAKHINEMISVCGHIFFPRGNYRLISTFNPSGKVPKELHKSIISHIGIYQSDIHLEGENGCNFITNEPLGTICIFSIPKSIENSVNNVKIENISFNVNNDGVNFYEFRHTIKVIGVNGLVIENCYFDDFWGDAICLSHYGDNPETGERTRNQNIRIINNTIVGGNHHSNRNGISIINGKNILVKGNVIRNTTRKKMPGGIDIEPNNSAYTLENIIIKENQIEDVLGSAIALIIQNGSPAHHVEMLSNNISRCLLGIYVQIDTENTTDSLIIKNNYVDAKTRPYRFGGKGKSSFWVIKGNIFDNLSLQEIPGKIQVQHLIVQKNKKKYFSLGMERTHQYIYTFRFDNQLFML